MLKNIHNPVFIRIQGEDWRYEESRNQARTFDEEQEYLDSADEEEIDNLAADDDEKKVTTRL